MSSNPPFQLISSDGVYQRGFEEFIRLTDFNLNEKNYNTISIIGCQSSGKSTLLNSLFETDFKTMDRRIRVQTTHGIWVSNDKKENILVFDVEGTDSKEKWGDHLNEKVNALFTLLISDIFIINVWTNEIGRYEAVQYHIISEIFRLKMENYPNERPINLVYAFRDFEEDDDLEFIKKIFEADLEKIWSDSVIPKNNKKPDFKKSFKIQFFPLASFQRKRTQFCEDVYKMKKELIKLINDKIIPEDSFPLRDFPNFCEDYLWKSIQNKKSAFLPNDRELLALTRLQEFYYESIKLMEKKLFLIEKELEGKKSIKDFNQIIDKIKNEILENFIEKSKFYDKRIQIKFISDLDEIIRNRVRRLNIKQFMNIKFENIENFKKKLHKYEKLNSLINLGENIEEDAKEILLEYNNLIKNSNYNTYNADGLTNLLNEQKNIINDYIKGMKEKFLDIYIETINKKNMNIINNFLLQNLENNTKLSFWKDCSTFFSEHYTNFYSDFYKNLMSIKKKQDFIDTEFNDIVKEDFEHLKRKIETIIERIDFILFNNFQYKMNHNDKGIPRIWSFQPKEELLKEFDSNLDFITKLNDIFKGFKLNSTVIMDNKINIKLVEFRNFNKRNDFNFDKCFEIFNISKFEQNNIYFEEIDHPWKKRILTIFIIMYLPYKIWCYMNIYDKSKEIFLLLPTIFIFLFIFTVYRKIKNLSLKKIIKKIKQF